MAFYFAGLLIPHHHSKFIYYIIINITHVLSVSFRERHEITLHLQANNVNKSVLTG